MLKEYEKRSKKEAWPPCGTRNMTLMSAKRATREGRSAFMSVFANGSQVKVFAEVHPPAAMESKWCKNRFTSTTLGPSAKRRERRELR